MSPSPAAPADSRGAPAAGAELQVGGDWIRQDSRVRQSGIRVGRSFQNCWLGTERVTCTGPSQAKGSGTSARQLMGGKVEVGSSRGTQAKKQSEECHGQRAGGRRVVRLRGQSASFSFSPAFQILARARDGMLSWARIVARTAAGRSGAAVPSGRGSGAANYSFHSFHSVSLLRATSGPVCCWMARLQRFARSGPHFSGLNLTTLRLTLLAMPSPLAPGRGDPLVLPRVSGCCQPHLERMHAPS